MDHTAEGWITDLSEDECRARLETTTVGVIAFVDASDGQQLIPVNFAVLRGAIYFLTAVDGVLAHLADGHPDVAFGVVHEDVFGVGWNVTVRGPAREVRDPDIIDMVHHHERLKPWAGGARPVVIEVALGHIRGRRVSANELGQVAPPTAGSDRVYRSDHQ